MQLFTAAQAAEQIQCDKSTITRLCGKHGIGSRLGVALALTADDIAKLRSLKQPAPGNPQMRTSEFGRRAAAAKAAKRAASPPKKTRKA